MNKVALYQALPSSRYIKSKQAILLSNTLC